MAVNVLKVTMLLIKYGYMFRLFLNHPQANWSQNLGI